MMKKHQKPGHWEGVISRICDEEPQRTTLPSRCPDCGALVPMPCRACLLTASDLVTPWHPSEMEDGPIVLSCELQGDELVRYLDTKHRRDIRLPELL